MVGVVRVVGVVVVVVVEVEVEVEVVVKVRAAGWWWIWSKAEVDLLWSCWDSVAVCLIARHMIPYCFGVQRFARY